MIQRRSLVGSTLLVLTVVAVGQAAFAAPQRPGNVNAQQVQAIVREGETGMRQKLNEYEQRLGQLNFSQRPNPGARNGMNDSIVNGYRSYLTAMTRVRDESDARISHLNGVSPAVRNNAIRTLATSFQSNAHTLQSREQDAMRKLHLAERR